MTITSESVIKSCIKNDNPLNSLGKPIRCSGKPRILSFPPTHLINSIIHEHSCKILYIYILLKCDQDYIVLYFNRRMGKKSVWLRRVWEVALGSVTVLVHRLVPYHRWPRTRPVPMALRDLEVKIIYIYDFSPMLLCCKFHIGRNSEIWTPKNFIWNKTRLSYGEKCLWKLPLEWTTFKWCGKWARFNFCKKLVIYQLFVTTPFPPTQGDSGVNDFFIIPVVQRKCLGCDYMYVKCGCISSQMTKMKAMAGQSFPAYTDNAGLLAGLWWMKSHSFCYSPGMQCHGYKWLVHYCFHAQFYWMSIF